MSSDRETLESGLVATISPTQEVVQSFKKRVILSDPDWRSWLRKSGGYPMFSNYGGEVMFPTWGVAASGRSFLTPFGRVTFGGINA